MKTKMEDMNEHLFEMAERLLDDDLCSDAEKTEAEVKKAQAIVNISNAIVSLQELGLRKTELDLKMCKVANNMGLEYIPENIAKQLDAPVKKKF